MDQDSTAGERAGARAGRSSDAGTGPTPFLGRAAPFLRSVGQAMEQNAELRETRDAIVRETRGVIASRAGELVRRADEALARVTAVEGTVVDRSTSPATPTVDANAPASRPSLRYRLSTSPAAPRDGHWTRRRFGRMALAAAREAARPARSPSGGITRMRLAVAGIVTTMLAVMLLRRRRHRR